MELRSSGLLTQREAEVLSLIAEGGTNKTVARDLGVSRYTVRNHLENVFRKLDVSTRTEAAVTALRAGWIE